MEPTGGLRIGPKLESMRVRRSALSFFRTRTKSSKAPKENVNWKRSLDRDLGNSWGLRLIAHISDIGISPRRRYGSRVSLNSCSLLLVSCVSSRSPEHGALISGANYGVRALIPTIDGVCKDTIRWILPWVLSGSISIG
jgi:hypothetical protein